ncbi:DUF6197 family protein [Pseudonocardia sichuanensis]
MYDTLPVRPIPEPDLTPAVLAEIIEQAAHLIARTGLHVGDFWPGEIEWTPGQPCCTAGALGLASGYRSRRDVNYAFVGIDAYDVATQTYRADDPHPALLAVMRHLRFGAAEELFAWSDVVGRDVVVRTLQGCAAGVRNGAST